MSSTMKNQKKLLAKLGVEQLNPMQEEAQLAIHSASEVVLLSPTGTGKTLAFLLPIIAELDRDGDEIQTLILVPSRELAIQIEQVAREMGAGIKINTVYGGRPFSKEKMDLKHRPALLIGTPGRTADHIRRHTFPTNKIKTLVLDEFDKSLQIGFEEEMEEITQSLRHLSKKILTSATHKTNLPSFIRIKNPIYVNFLDEAIEQLQIKAIYSPEKDKLATLVAALCHLGDQPGIIFCNFKNAIERISDYLHDHNIRHGCFHGGMEQKDRERTLAKFRNGSQQLILATDLAARGIDVPEIKFILHYHLPPRKEEFIHRNGRTARMNRAGTAFLLQWKEEPFPDFIETPEEEIITSAAPPPSPKWATIMISGGRKDKISKGDIAGLFFKQGELKKDELGVIELKQDCAFVAVSADKVSQVIGLLDNSKVKKRKIRTRLI